MKNMLIFFISLSCTPLLGVYPNVTAKSLHLSEHEIYLLEQLHHLASSPQSRTFELDKLFKQGAGNLVNVIYDYSTALSKAAEELHPNLDNMTFLLDHGADVNARNSDGSTALMAAIEFSMTLEPIELLLHRGADLHMTNKKGKSAAYLAEKSRNKKIQKLVRRYL
jgi:ankyrin repeat protein